ncbi:C2 calcium-dependent domain-containing protein 4C-like [Coregonus clupeaformis]|uniref:C2 calcium-dependent domain-containing protein 4C-like n=1 Tax=Coregonus clupeaformis TaxID=59861 RepID=UPI001E1C92DB|nr:C2 calcium-dependent domain-containing protein 4C-like [Coregonus clupeaformis]
MWVVEQIRVLVAKNNLPFLIAEYSISDIMLGEKTSREKRRKTFSLCPNIITPNTIPEFCIPPKISPQQELKTVDWSKTSPLGKVSFSPEQDSSPEREVAVREPFINTHPTLIQVESVDEAPYGQGFSDEESTNADPQSQAALSLPHLAKAQTCYGFCTLLESPHTRRKESLFHSYPNACPLPLIAASTGPCGRSNTYSSRPSPLPHSRSPSFSLTKLTSRLSPGGSRLVALQRQGTLDSDTTSSAESSPFSSPLLTRPPPKSSLLKALSHDRLLSRTMRKAVLSRNNSLSTDEGSSTDNSPNIIRRASDAGLVEPLPSAFTLAPPAIFPIDLVLYRERVMNESRVPVGREGALRLSAEYCPDNQRLRVRLISAEGLYAISVDPKSINCSVSICLLPGKIQKQRSAVIKRSRNPIFNEDFFFDGISEEDISCRSLRFKVVNKMSSMKRDYILGDCEILLNSVLSM